MDRIERLYEVNKSIRRLEALIRAEEWNVVVEKYAPEVMKSKRVEHLTDTGKNLLTKLYAKCRKDGMGKTYSANLAFKAVRYAGYVAVSREKILSAIAKNMERLAEFAIQKSDPVQNHVSYAGIPIDLEWLNGQERHWEGSPYRNPMVGTGYGYIRNTVDGDGEEVDVYLADPAQADAPVFMMNQLKENGTFDEHKFFLGFATAEQAQTAYTKAMPEEMMGEMVEMSLQEFEDKYLKFHKDDGGGSMQAGLDATAPSVQTNNVEKAGVAPGTRHTWSDGTVHEKQTNGYWKIVGENKGGHRDDISHSDFEKKVIIHELGKKGKEVVSGKGGFFVKGEGFISHAQARKLSGVDMSEKREKKEKQMPWGDYATIAMLNQPKKNQAESPSTPKAEEPAKVKTGEVFKYKAVRGEAGKKTDAGDYGKGRYSTGDMERAKAYGPVSTVDIELKNPLVFNTTKEARAFRRKTIGEELLNQSQSEEASLKMDSAIRKLGHDGIVVYDSEGNYTSKPDEPFEIVELSKKPE